ncbi:MAG: DUF948 domain-containing protein [Bacillota bacterium]|nr:DUF948 domain-containing protein [Bacillota bacterium]
MNASDIALLVIALVCLVTAVFVVRLLSRLQRTADALDNLLNSTRHQLEMTAERSRETMTQVQSTTAELTVQMRNAEKILASAGNLVENVRSNSVLVQKALLAPVAGLGGLVAGVSKGLEVLAQKRSKGEKE